MENLLAIRLRCYGLVNLVLFNILKFSCDTLTNPGFRLKTTVSRYAQMPQKTPTFVPAWPARGLFKLKGQDWEEAGCVPAFIWSTYLNILQTRPIVFLMYISFQLNTYSNNSRSISLFAPFGWDISILLPQGLWCVDSGLNTTSAWLASRLPTLSSTWPWSNCTDQGWLSFG